MRVFTRVFCTILAATFATIGVVAIVEITLALAERGPWLLDARPWFERLSSEPWSSPTHRLVLSLAFVAGIGLLLLAWAPRRPVTLPAAADRVPDDVQMTLRRRDVEHLIETSAREVPYVVDASARVDRRISLVAGSTRPSDESVRQGVEDAVRKAVHRLGMDESTVQVRVRQSAGRAA